MAPQDADEREQELAQETFHRVEQLFHAMRRMTPSEREDYLLREAVSEVMRNEVAALLECDEIHDDAFDEARLSASRDTKATFDPNPSVMASIGPGFVLGDFRLEAEVGRGGMAVVYRARQLSLDRTVALKVLCFPWIIETVHQRFRREAAASAKLHHDHIVTVYQFAQENNLLFFAMEMIEGPTLAEWLVRHRSQDAETDQQASLSANARHAQVCRWVADVACGLAHAHAHGVVHRDIKPSNLILSPEGRIKILDFGVAKLRSEPGLTTTGTFLGTPRYMSPEQLSPTGQEADHRADIYSLGATLYELLTLEPPYPGDDFGQVIGAIGSSDPCPPRQRDRSIPATLEAICLRAMAREPDKRYQRADELASDLENYLEGLPVSVRPLSQLGRFGRALGRNRQRVALAAVTILCVLGAVLWKPSAVTRLKLANQRHITSDRGFNADPSLSADGRWLVYASDSQGNGDSNIWMQELNQDGSKKGDPFQITAEVGDETEPAVSPDGRLVAYYFSGKDRGIYTRTIGESRDVGQATRLCLRGRGPRFSPDGEWIAYWVGSSGRMLSERGESIWLAPMAGGPPRRLCPEFTAVAHPVWSPDGQKILFCGAPPAGTTEAPDARWWVTPVEGGEPTPIDIVPLLREQGIELPSLCVPWCWTPNSHFVIFSGFLNERFKLWAVPMDPDNLRIGKLQQLTPGGSQEFYACVAPNGRISFAAVEYDYGLWNVPLDANQAVTTGPIAPIADNPAIDSHPNVTADGALLVFNSDRGGDTDIYAVRGDSPATRLVGGKGHQTYAVISADGAKIAYMELTSQDSGAVGKLLYVAALKDLQVDASEVRLLGEDLGMPLDWHPSAPARYLMTSGNRGLQIVDTETGDIQRILEHPAQWIGSASFSPNGQWITFSANGQIFVAAVELGKAASPSWIPITAGASDDNVPDWSPDGNTLYFLSDRDGRPCIWCQVLHPTTKQPTGPPREVHHFRNYRRSPVSVGSHLRPLTVAPDRLILCLGNYSGNILVARLETE